MQQADILILGGSICGLMTACYLKLKMPEMDVVVVGPHPSQEKRPIVGESLLEPATYFFHRVGMKDYLEREHAIKQGLSFYYKLSPDDRPKSGSAAVSGFDWPTSSRSPTRFNARCGGR